MLRLLHQFEEAKNFGSLIQPCLSGQAIVNAPQTLEAKDLGSQIFVHETHRKKVLRILNQSEALTQRYHAVVANPPYMGGGTFNLRLKELASDMFSATKSRPISSQCSSRDGLFHRNERWLRCDDHDAQLDVLVRFSNVQATAANEQDHRCNGALGTKSF